MNNLVVDSSVVVKWFVPEDDNVAADRIWDSYLHDKIKLVAPDLLIVEVANILWKKRDTIGESEAVDILFQVISSGIEIVSSESLIESAYRFARRYSRTAYDSLYLALADSYNCDLVTSDERLFNAVAAQEPRVKLLRAYPVE